MNRVRVATRQKSVFKRPAGQKEDGKVFFDKSIPGGQEHLITSADIDPALEAMGNDSYKVKLDPVDVSFFKSGAGTLEDAIGAGFAIGYKRGLEAANKKGTSPVAESR